jgi:CheY-like chemotaxis protein
VTDTGHGISPEDLDKIFEPFFTTKETGKGTGLGLSQVYGFAKQSGGEIEVESEQGRGTRFTLYLPDAPGGSAPEQPAESKDRDVPVGGRVLVVEDNEEVGQFAEQVLGELGFEARLVSSADEALTVLADDSGYDLVFSDVVMPGADGIELAREIRERWPTLPVVLTSGYSHVLASRAEHAFPLLHKPYSLESLAAVIGKAIAGRKEQPAEQ